MTRDDLTTMPRYATPFCFGCAREGGRAPGDYRPSDDGLLRCTHCGAPMTLAYVEPTEYEPCDVSAFPGVKSCFVRTTHIVALGESAPTQ